MPLGAEAIGQALSAGATGDGRIVLQRLAEVAALHSDGMGAGPAPGSRRLRGSCRSPPGPATPFG